VSIAREPIFGGLFALVSAVPGLVTTSRTLKHWNDVGSSERPALFQAQGRQAIEQTQANGLPSKWKLGAKLYLYCSTDGPLSPGEVMNPIMDGLTSLFEPNGIGYPQTLGGLVQWARITDVDTSEGTLGDIEVAILTVSILAV
jgi:hypothetical protein